MGYYNMTNDQPPLHEHRDPAIDNYAAVALDLPAQAQANPPAPVCADFTSCIRISNQNFRRSRL